MKERRDLNRALVREFLDLAILTEEVPSTKATDPTKFENDSLDAQVDRLLLQADGDKDETGAPKVESRRSLRALIMEAGDDEQPAPVTPPQGQQAPQQQIDTMSFCDAVARLVEKADSLLDIKGTIVRRALNYVSKNYDQKQAQEVQQVLEGNFNLAPDGSDTYSDENVPAAVGAGPELGQ